MTEGQFRQILRNRRNWSVDPLGQTAACAQFLREAARDVRACETATKAWQQCAPDGLAEAGRVISFQRGRLVVEASDNIAAIEIQSRRAKLRQALQRVLPTLVEICVEQRPAVDDQENYERDDRTDQCAGGNPYE